MSDPPKGWTKANIGDLAEYVSRGRSPKYVEKSELPVINQRCVRWHGVDEAFVKFVDPATWHQWDDDRYVRRNDILWNSTGTGTIGRAALFTELRSYDRAVVDSHVTIVRAGPAIDPAYLFGFIQSPAVQDKIEDMQSGSTNQVELNRSEILSTVVPVAPLPEQRRVVAKVDGLTARTARARKELDRIPTLIARYKQRLLALAFSGELTASWRKANEVAPAQMTPISRVCRTITDGDHQAPPRANGGIPFITISAMNDGNIDLSKASRFVPQSYYDDLKESRQAQIGDVLFSVTGSIGIPALVKDEAPFVFQRHIAILKPDARHTSGAFLRYMLESPDVKTQCLAIATGTAQLTVPLSGLRNFTIPLPTKPEQAEIVRRIESAFGWLDRMAADHAAAARLLLKLDAAILAKAFRGALVPQDPNDEPASVMLERIKAEGAVAPKAKRGRQAHKTGSPKDLHTMAKNLEQVLAEAGDWISAQDAFQQCGIDGAATTEKIENIYAELRKLDKAGRVEAESVNDDQGRKLHDRLRLKVA